VQLCAREARAVEDDGGAEQAQHDHKKYDRREAKVLCDPRAERDENCAYAEEAKRNEADVSRATMLVPELRRQGARRRHVHVRENSAREIDDRLVAELIDEAILNE